MATLKEQMFQQVANVSLDRLRNELRDKFKPKKDGRFMVKGITYEIGAIKVVPKGLQFEISSKIPQDQLPKRTTIDRYFSQVIKEVSKAKKKPEESKMENIVQNANGKEFKERDYVKLIYVFPETELYKEKEIDRQIQLVQSKKLSVPDFPGVTTLGGKLVLQAVGECIYKGAKDSINALMEANEAVRKKYAASN